MKYYSIIKNGITHFSSTLIRLLEKTTFKGIPITDEKGNVVDNIYISARCPLFYHHMFDSHIEDQTSEQREEILKLNR